ncbi:hypothetical protein JGU71_29325 [Antrihabitans sp. YC3-6]|uniref:Abi-like protein n=1 Tax=Antrihabitans stalagmiti TaxID=2799499 RepID=A0A934U6Y0_9NOCA|nr:hypothetical protein [Antrihabitans stalagmiti]MBJ8342991.1 hypothetical protein [Antrihabitans stalagmiti]
MQQKSVMAVVSHLSRPRFDTYLAVAGSDRAALELYRWNVEMAGALQESLGVVEVMLRNAIDRELKLWNPQQPSPTGSAAFAANWVERPAPPLHKILNPPARGRGRPAHSTFATAKKRAQSDCDLRSPGHPRHRFPVSHDDVVAHITFGTWVKLLPKKTSGSAVSGQQKLWTDALHAAFPHNPSPLVVHFWVNRLHQLRNRVAHLEPLILTDVRSYHLTAARLLGAIEPGLRDWYAGTSRVPVVLAAKP